MNSTVLDASAILALILAEPGSDDLQQATLETTVASAVNLAEVQGKLILNGWSPELAWKDAKACVDRVEPLSEDQAQVAGALIQQTKPYGLSLGDRCCLALALSLKAPVYTADKIWEELKVGVPVHVIR